MKWFKHDTDANRDAKLEKVLMKYGAEGYALYWLCIELIAAPIDKHNLSFELEHDVEILSFRLKIDSAKCEEIMRFFVAQELFEMNATTNKIKCLKLASRLEYSAVKNPQLKQIQDELRREKQADEDAQSRTIPDNDGQPVPDKTRTEEKRLEQNRELITDPIRIETSLGEGPEIDTFTGEVLF